MINSKLDNKGFSLVEILVALGISSIILLGVATFMRSGGDSYRVAASQASLQNETQDIMNYLTNMIQASSDAGWKDECFFVMQPDALNETNGYVVHVLKHDEPNQRMFYKKGFIADTDFTASKVLQLKNGLETKDNLISTKVGSFEARVERYAAKPTPQPDGSAGTDAVDSRTQSLSKVDITLEIFAEDEHKLTRASVRPRNLITKKYFHQLGIDMKTSKSPITSPGGVASPSLPLARPNGDVDIGTDGYPTLR